MSRPKTQDVPDLSALLVPQNDLMLAVERAVLRGRETSQLASLAEQIAAKLAGVITLDLVHAGQRLLEQDISHVLHVSRAPVREALRILERDRLVEFQPRRGALVTAPDATDLRDVYSVRSALYAMLLQQVMGERPADLEAVFDAHMPQVTEAAQDSVDAYAVATFLLNFAIADLSSNRLLADLLQSISLRTLRYVRLGLASNPAAMPAFAKSWCDLHEAVAKRDSDLVVEIAKQRISEIRDTAVLALDVPQDS
ncbi:GntR family transcriptional regulator [Streptomyces sp. NPDC056309]|uniref:GntR family transcriptional regulator n=1 Tax=unclassified Streptomyces TaxID=2593676 RepID=UPI0035D9FD2E